jgi:hypothetical protein
VFFFLTLVLLALPWSDELVGKLQFDGLCKDAEEVKIYGTKPVGEELYFSDGRWRLTSSPSLPLSEFNRAQAIYDSLVRYERADIKVSGITMPIGGSETRIFDREADRLLASYRIYHTRGGWISRGSEKPSIVRDQCLPNGFGAVAQRILPYRQVKGTE